MQLRSCYVTLLRGKFHSLNFPPIGVGLIRRPARPHVGLGLRPKFLVDALWHGCRDDILSSVRLSLWQCLNCEKLAGGVELFEGRRPNKIVMQIVCRPKLYSI